MGSFWVRHGFFNRLIRGHTGNWVIVVSSCIVGRFSVRHLLFLTPYLSNTPTNLCMALLNFSLFCFVLYCYAFVQYCNVKTIQYNAMHKFVGVLDNPL